MWKWLGAEVRWHMSMRGHLAPLIVRGTSISIVNDYSSIIGVGTRKYEDRGIPKPDNDNYENWDHDYDPFDDPRYDGFPNA